MFCSKCGKNIADDAAFCDGCGTAVNGTSTNKASSLVLKNLIDTLKGFLSPKTAVKTVGDSAKSTGISWLIFGGAYMFAYTLYTILSTLINYSGSTSFTDMSIGQFADLLGMAQSGPSFPFFELLLEGIVLSGVFFFGFALGSWLLVAVIYKKQVKITQALNMVSVALVPLTIIYIVNILIYLIWSPMVSVTFTAAEVMAYILIYAGIQKFEKLESSPFYPYAILAAAVSLLSLLFSKILP